MKMKEKKNHKADIILLAALVLVGTVLACLLLLTRQKGAYAEVRVSGQSIQRFSLRDSVCYEIRGADGDGNLLIVEDGEAWIEEADCPDGLCCQMGRIHSVGQSVVCLPNEVVVEIIGKTAETDTVDLIVG